MSLIDCERFFSGKSQKLAGYVVDIEFNDIPLAIEKNQSFKNSSKTTC